MGVGTQKFAGMAIALTGRYSFASDRQLSPAEVRAVLEGLGAVVVADVGLATHVVVGARGRAEAALRKEMAQGARLLTEAEFSALLALTAADAVALLATPEGQQFQLPVEVFVFVPNADLTGVDPADLTLFATTATGIEGLTGITIDIGSSGITVSTWVRMLSPHPD